MRVSWDDDIRNWMESPTIHVPNHQPDNIMETYYPLVICYIAIEHGHRNSWFTIKHGGCFHRFLYVYQRVLVSLPWTLVVLYCIYIYICTVYNIYIIIYIHQCPLEIVDGLFQSTNQLNMIPGMVPGSHPILWHWDCPANLPVLSTCATRGFVGEKGGQGDTRGDKGKQESQEVGHVIQ